MTTILNYEAKTTIDFWYKWNFNWSPLFNDNKLYQLIFFKNDMISWVNWNLWFLVLEILKNILKDLYSIYTYILFNKYLLLGHKVEMER